MISAIDAPQEFDVAFSFSAIARSVMISAKLKTANSALDAQVSVL